MIRFTKVILTGLNGGTALEENISDIQEIIENNNEYTQRALTINFHKNAIGNSADLNHLDEIFSLEGGLTNIKIYGKERIEDEDGVASYGDELVILESTEYIKVRSLIKHYSSGLVSVILLK